MASPWSTIGISNAIVAASAAGGGTVEIPAAAGAYLCGPLLYRSSVNLQIDSGATLKMLPYGQWPGGTSPPDFIVGSSLHDVEISGFGTIDGSATSSGWWNGLQHFSTALHDQLEFLPAVADSECDYDQRA